MFALGGGGGGEGEEVWGGCWWYGYVNHMGSTFVLVSFLRCRFVVIMFVSLCVFRQEFVSWRGDVDVGVIFFAWLGNHMGRVSGCCLSMCYCYIVRFRLVFGFIYVLRRHR